MWWLYGQLRDEVGARGRRGTLTTIPVKGQVLCALRFFAVGSYQGIVATDERLAFSQPSVCVVVRRAAAAIVRGPGDIDLVMDFLMTTQLRHPLRRSFIFTEC